MPEITIKLKKKYTTPKSGGGFTARVRTGSIAAKKKGKGTGLRPRRKAYGPF